MIRKGSSQSKLSEQLSVSSEHMFRQLDDGRGLVVASSTKDLTRAPVMRGDELVTTITPMPGDGVSCSFLLCVRRFVFQGAE